VECDVLFRESRVTFFMGAIMGDSVRAYSSAAGEGGERWIVKVNGVVDCTG
jgi:hypothetical protein